MRYYSAINRAHVYAHKNKFRTSIPLNLVRSSLTINKLISFTQLDDLKCSLSMINKERNIKVSVCANLSNSLEMFCGFINSLEFRL